MKLVYGKLQEKLVDYFPIPKGKQVCTTTFCDDNLMHDTVTGGSASVILDMLNQTPIDWMSKQQN